MTDLALLRGQYGTGTFLTRLPDGEIIPWKPLSLKDYLEMQMCIKTGQYPLPYLEEEIFCKCVLDSNKVTCLDLLKAGTVSAVAYSILAFSGPQEASELNGALGETRQMASQIIHQMTILICEVFPAYKPDDLYEMPYDTFMLRLAQAESSLLRRGILSEPLSFDSPKEPKPVEASKPKVELRDAWSAQESKPKPKPRVVTPPSKTTVITKEDMREQEFAYIGHDRVDAVLIEDQMMKDTYPIYKDYLEQVAKGQKFQVKSVEERLAEAHKREEQNKKELAEKAKQKVLELRAVEAKGAKLFEEAKAKKKRR